MSNIFITGGAGFIGSNIARHYSKGNRVAIYDNLSRGKLLSKKIHSTYNWDALGKLGIERIKGDVRSRRQLESSISRIRPDTIFHMAGQTGVTSSMIDPAIDFDINAKGTFKVLEAARKNDVKNIIYASTNKVYGNNVNKVKKECAQSEWKMIDPENGIPESFSIDHCEHTQYGCSKLAADLYVQDYAHLYGMKTGVFRMSCIYGPNQFGVEDQGWVAWFTIATLLGKNLNIYGDGKQVRDVLYVEDLINAYDMFLKSKIKNAVYNIGGGTNNRTSLLQLVDLLEQLTGKRSNVIYNDWRPADQEVYISDISKIKKELGWEPTTSLKDGLNTMIEWINKNKKLFC